LNCKEAKMAEYDNRNRFTLFKNTKKREGKQDADFNGTFTDGDGREYWINAWTTTPKSGGEKFLSGSVKLKENPLIAKAKPAQVRQESLDDNMPF
jgi:hypothetical protein